MTKPASDRWYPDRSVFHSEQAYNAHTQALDLIYGLRDEVRGMKRQSPEKTKEKGVPKEGPGSFKETYLAGILVKPSVPSNGQSLKYNAATGQFEFS